jgi:hypothetical protein
VGGLLDFFRNRSERPEIEPRSAGCSRGFGEHAPRLRNGLRVQTQTRPARALSIAGLISGCAVGFERSLLRDRLKVTARADLRSLAPFVPITWVHSSTEAPPARCTFQTGSKSVANPNVAATAVGLYFKIMRTSHRHLTRPAVRLRLPRLSNGFT